MRPGCGLRSEPGPGDHRAGEPPARGPRATRQLIVTGTYADGSVRDLTRALSWTSLDPAVATVSAAGRSFPRATARPRSSRARVRSRSRRRFKVERMEQPAPVSFRRDVIPAFSQAGCNTGACHGTPTGKGGFRLSLRGYLPDQDFLTLSREVGGRRINLLAAETSLLLAQAAGPGPPRGRPAAAPELARASSSSTTGSRKGPRTTPTPPPPVKLEILPESRVLNAPGEDPAACRAAPPGRRHGPRRDPDLLLRLVQPRHRRG